MGTLVAFMTACVIYALIESGKPEYAFWLALVSVFLYFFDRYANQN